MIIKNNELNRRNLVIVLEELDFIWDEDKLNQLAEMWEENKSIVEMCGRFKRDADEILVACLHLARGKKISVRDGGLLGR